MFDKAWIREALRVLGSLAPFFIGFAAVAAALWLRRSVGLTGEKPLGEVFGRLEPPTDAATYVAEVRFRALWGVSAILFIVSGVVVVAISTYCALRSGGRSSRWWMIGGMTILGLLGAYRVGPNSTDRIAGKWLDVLYTRGDTNMSDLTAWVNAWTAFVIVMLITGFSWLTIAKRPGAEDPFDEAGQRRGALQRLLGVSTLVLIAAVAEVYLLYAWPSMYTADPATKASIIEFAVSASFAAGGSYSLLLGALYWTAAAMISARFGLSSNQSEAREAAASSRIPLPLKSLLSVERLQAFFGAMAPLIAAILLALLERMDVWS